MRIPLLTFVLLTNIFAIKAQSWKDNNNLDFSLSTSISESTIALGWNQMHYLGDKKRFGIGYGLRYSGYIGRDVEYLTAPADITTGRTGPSVFFSTLINENIDTVYIGNPGVSMFNVVVNLGYKLNDKWELNFNIDFVGFSLGGAKGGIFESADFPQYQGLYTANPTPFNVLLIGNNDIGSLNSEIYARYNYSSRFSFKFGLTYIFTEYTTDSSLAFENDRFRRKSFQVMAGVMFKPFLK